MNRKHGDFFLIRKASAGFSLFELMVVLMIISLITAVIIPRVGGSLNRLHLKVATKKVAAALRYARSQAAAEGKNYVASVDFETKQLEISAYNGGEEDPFSDEFDDSAEDGIVILSGQEEQINKPKIYSLPEGVYFEKAVGLNGEEETELFNIFFYPTGNSSGGQVTLKAENERQLTVEIDFITGTVKVVE